MKTLHKLIHSISSIILLFLGSSCRFGLLLYWLLLLSLPFLTGRRSWLFGRSNDLNLRLDDLNLLDFFLFFLFRLNHTFLELFLLVFLFLLFNSICNGLLVCLYMLARSDNK